MEWQAHIHEVSETDIETDCDKNRPDKEIETDRDRQRVGDKEGDRETEVHKREFWGSVPVSSISWWSSSRSKQTWQIVHDSNADKREAIKWRNESFWHKSLAARSIPGQYLWRKEELDPTLSSPYVMSFSYFYSVHSSVPASVFLASFAVFLCFLLHPSLPIS